MHMFLEHLAGVSLGCVGMPGKRKPGTEAIVVATPTAKRQSVALGESPAISADWVDACMALFDATVDEHKGCVVAFLQTIQGDDPQQYHYSMHQAFPEDPTVTYASTLGPIPGPVCLRLWMCNTSVMAGNKGLLELEACRNLVLLMLSNGVLTDPHEPGVEALVVQPLNPTFFGGSLDDVCKPFQGGLLLRSSVGFVKGWTRACCAHITAWLVMNTCGSAQLQEKLNPKLFETLRTLHALVPTGGKTDLELIDANRGQQPQSMCVAMHLSCFVFVTRCLARQTLLWHLRRQGGPRTPSPIYTWFTASLHLACLSTTCLRSGPALVKPRPSTG